MTRRLLSIVALLIALPCASPSSAEAQPSADDVASAHTHFERGITLYNEGHLDAALAELTRAYALAPAAAVLYNLGRVRAELGQPVEAARALADYLAQGGASISHARRTEVEALLEEQRARIAQVRVVANVDGSIISLDGVDVAQTPLAAPIALGTGHHTLGVRAPGYESVTVAIDVAGGDDRELPVTLRPAVVPRGLLRIESSPAGVHVAIDGTEIGVTPLDATVPVPAGEHDVVGTRAGYLSDARHVRVEDGAELDVRLRCEVDPDAPPAVRGRLVLVLPEGRASLRIDGQSASLLAAALTLPIGTHTLTLEVEDREPWTGEVVIPPEATDELAPPLWWTAEVRRQRLASAGSMRDAGVGMAVAGGAVLAAGLVVLIWNETQIASTDSQVAALASEFASMHCGTSLTLRCQTILTELRPPLAAQQSDENVVRAFSATATAVGGVLAGIGIALALVAPTSESIDRSAHARVRFGPTSVAVDGTF